MGRGRGKGKNRTVTSDENAESGEDEKVTIQKRRGRPQKPLKDDFDELEDVEKIEEDDSESVKNGVSTKEIKSPNASKHGRKRKRDLQTNEKLESIEKENGIGNRSNSDDLAKSNGFRHNRNRRKSKPHRAAEAGVQCK
ncbi:hypothetical protein SESBI_47429 [Sesbania bispinosa]|nr:hypothetical protein SESBI_47429 [Sesbania bispinosa]